MSASGRKRASKWDSKDGDTQNISGSDYIGKSSSYFRDKDPEHARFYPEGNGRNGSRRCVPDDDDDERLKSKQHSGEAWPPRSRVSHEDDDAVMGYYDPRISSEQDETRQQYLRQSLPRDRTRTNKSGSNSRSRSRSPLERVRRDGGGSYDRHKIRAHVSPRSGREIDGKYNRSGDYDWEAKHRKTSDSNSKYYTEDSREQQSARVGGAGTDYNSGFPEDNSNSRRETSDSFLRNHRNESARDRETQRRDIPEGEFHRRSNIPCRYFASGNCRNGNSCRFSHHGAAPPTRASPERKPHDEMFSRHDNNNHHGTTERMRNSHRWNDTERLDTGKPSEVEISRVSNKAISEAKGNNGSWIDDMEMSPDWNYRVKTLKKPMIEEQGVISQSSQSRVLESTLPPAYEQDGNRRSIGMLLTASEKTASSSHHSFSNNLTNSAPPPVQGFNQNIENHSAVLYQSTPLAVGVSQVVLPVAENLQEGLKMNNPENGNSQNTVSMEELNHISNISASLAQFFGNGQPSTQLHSALNLKQAMQVVPEVYGNKEQSPPIQSNLLSNSSIHTGGVPTATALHINNSDTQQVQIPDSLVSLAGNPKATSEEKGDKKTDEEASKERKTGKEEEEEEEEEENVAEDAENVVEEEEEDGDKNNKKEKDPKGMRAFKFALVEIVKELLKPAWKEGGMNKDAYKNIVKKVVDKVTGTIQTGNIPQTQEKIDHYLSASKPKLTKLVQAYISKVKKS